MHEHVNIHLLWSLLWDYVHTAVCEKCLVHIEESVTTGGFVQAHSPVCSTLELHREQKNKKSSQFFFGVVRLGGCLEREGG